MGNIIKFPTTPADECTVPTEARVALENWAIDVEDGYRGAAMAIDVMSREHNPVILVNLLRQYAGELSPQLIGMAHCLAERLAG